MAVREQQAYIPSYFVVQEILYENGLHSRNENREPVPTTTSCEIETFPNNGTALAASHRAQRIARSTRSRWSVKRHATHDLRTVWLHKIQGAFNEKEFRAKPIRLDGYG
jgi:hypothetical protein